MKDKDIIEGLLNRDGRTTYWFLHVKCRPLFLSLISRLFDYPVEYSEFVDELYAYLMENDGYKLRQFDYRSTLCQWVKVIAIRYFIKNRKSLIDTTSKDAPLIIEEAICEEEANNGRIDLIRLFSQMANKRYAQVLRLAILEERPSIEVAEQLGVTVENLYNIKKRAIEALTKMVANEKVRYHGKN